VEAPRNHGRSGEYKRRLKIGPDEFGIFGEGRKVQGSEERMADVQLQEQMSEMRDLAYVTIDPSLHLLHSFTTPSSSSSKRLQCPFLSQQARK
jgi:hypothetical protein